MKGLSPSEDAARFKLGRAKAEGEAGNVKGL
jgi:hypothetical protein